jgi:type III restriction enzyme
VNQQGERLRGFDINTLTVIATESYEKFAENLQREIEVDTGIRFGVIEPHHFTIVTEMGPNGQLAPLSSNQSKAIWEHLKTQGYIDGKGRVLDSLKIALKEKTFSLPDSFAAQSEQIVQILRKQAGRLEIKNADERRQVPARQAVLNSPEFKALWDRIKHKTTYRVYFDNELLIADCIQALRDAPPVPKPRMHWRKAHMAIGKGGVLAVEREGSDTTHLHETHLELPDLLTDLQDRTQLTRRSIRRILSESGRLDDFKVNPQHFIELAAQIINHQKRLALVDGIKYQRRGDDCYYAQELFEEKELTGYLRNMIPSKKSVYEQVVYDSEGIERPFAEELERHEAVKVYAKLPGWFKVPTPLGTYNPDWAVLIEQDGAERVYFVVETKSSLMATARREGENAKIKCGKRHFSALKTGKSSAQYKLARSLKDLLH